MRTLPTNSNYHKYSEYEKEQARNTDMIDFLGSYEGFTFKKAGNEFHCIEHNSLVVKADRQGWYWNSKDIGGATAIDYCMRIHNLKFADAMASILGNPVSEDTHRIQPQQKIQTPEQPDSELQHLVIPEQMHYENGKRQYANIVAYLTKQRCIDSAVLNELINCGMIYQGVSYKDLSIIGYNNDGKAFYKWTNKAENADYEEVILKSSKEATETYTAHGFSSDYVANLVKDGATSKYPLVVALGRDENSLIKFATYRAAYTMVKFRGDCVGSNKGYSFSLPGTIPNKLYVFEAFIEVLSHCTLANIIKNNPDEWRKHNRLSLSGTADVALDKYLKLNPKITELYLCLNNDVAGQSASAKIVEKYSKLGYAVHIRPPINNDYNDDLCQYIELITQNCSQSENDTSKLNKAVKQGIR